MDLPEVILGICAGVGSQHKFYNFLGSDNWASVLKTWPLPKDECRSSAFGCRGGFEKAAHKIALTCILLVTTNKKESDL